MPLFIRGRTIEAIAPFTTTGLTVSTILYDESRNPTNGTATEIGSTANYYYSFVPDIVGDWRLVMYNGTEKHVFFFPVYDYSDTSTTHSITTSNDTVETQIFEVVKAGLYNLSVFIDLSTLQTYSEGGTVTLRLYNKIDGTNYRILAETNFVVGTTTEHPSFEVNCLHQYSKVMIQCSGDVTTTRAITYRYVAWDIGP